MKKNLFSLIVMLIIGFTLSAQKNTSLLIEADGIALPAALPSTAKATDTTDIFFPTFILPCGDSLVTYTLQNNEGYITGNNIYGDLEKGMLIRNQGKAEVVEVMAYLLKKGTLGTSTCAIKIYSKGTNNLPGTLLGTSQAKVLSSISTGLHSFTFAAPINVEGDFFASVVLPTNAGDTIVVVSTKETCTGPDSSAVEKWDDNTFSYMKTSWGGFNADLVIIPSIIKNYTVGFNVINGNGNLTASIGGTPITSVATTRNGKDVNFTATPAANYQVKEWKLNGTVVSGNTSNNYTLSNLQANAVVTVEFETTTTPTMYTVEFGVISANGGLTASVDGSPITSIASVEAGKNVFFTAAPATNYQVKEWKLNGTVVAGNTSSNYTLSNIQANALVTVEFEEAQNPTIYTVEFSVINANGNLMASVDANPITSIANVEEGKDVVFMATPAANYQVKEWNLNGNLVQGNTSNNYTLLNIQANAVVTVEFEEAQNPTTYTVEFSVVNANGNLTATVDAIPITSIANVEQGKDVVFTAAPASGFRVKEWNHNGGLVQGNTSDDYTLLNIQANATVSVEFEHDGTSISEKSESKFSIYPNPAIDKIQFNADMRYVMNITNINGQTVLSQNVMNGFNEINISNLNNGIYFIQFLNNKNSFIVKLVKK